MGGEKRNMDVKTMSLRELCMLLACSSGDTYKKVYWEYALRKIRPIQNLRSNLTIETVRKLTDEELKLLLIADITEPSRTLVRREYFNRKK